MGLTVERQTYTVTETAAMLGIGRTLLYDLINRREIPAIKLGDRTVIARHVVEAILRGESLSGGATSHT